MRSWCSGALGSLTWIASAEPTRLCVKTVAFATAARTGGHQTASDGKSKARSAAITQCDRSAVSLTSGNASRTKRVVRGVASARLRVVPVAALSEKGRRRRLFPSFEKECRGDVVRAARARPVRLVRHGQADFPFDFERPFKVREHVVVRPDVDAVMNIEQRSAEVLCQVGLGLQRREGVLDARALYRYAADVDLCHVEEARRREGVPKQRRARRVAAVREPSAFVDRRSEARDPRRRLDARVRDRPVSGREHPFLPARRMLELGDAPRRADQLRVYRRAALGGRASEP